MKPCKQTSQSPLNKIYFNSGVTGLFVYRAKPAASAAIAKRVHGFKKKLSDKEIKLFKTQEYWLICL
jgi:hypothetical protein